MGFQCINANSEGHNSDPGLTPDFTIEDLNVLKQDFLNLEKSFDAIEVTNNEGVTFPGSFMFELLENANVSHCTETLPIIKHKFSSHTNFS